MLSVVLYPDPALSLICEPVVHFDSELSWFIERMIEVMYREGGIGLAASQLGSARRVIVTDPSAGGVSGTLRAMINPEVTWASPELTVGDEGCLSLPGVRLQVPRARAVVVEYDDPVGQHQRLRCSDLQARVVQHEIDHLNGVMVLQRVGPLARRLALATYRRN